MANIEDAMAGLQAIMEQDLPGFLATITAEWNDGIKLDPIAAYDWEELHKGGVRATPAALLMGIEESDPVLRDQIRDATIIVYLIITDRQKSALTKKLFRYADGLRRMLRSAVNRTLRGKIISAKVVRVKYSPTWVSRDNLFTRDLEATIVVRVPRGES